MIVNTRRQLLPVFTAITVLIGVLVILQLWLLAASVEATLGGAGAIAVPATIASAVLLVANASLLLFVVALDRRRGRRDERS